MSAFFVGVYLMPNFNVECKPNQKPKSAKILQKSTCNGLQIQVVTVTNYKQNKKYFDNLKFFYIPLF